MPTATETLDPEELEPEPLPRLRRDLEFVPRQTRRRVTGEYLLRDPKSGEVFEVGPFEFAVCRAMDGETTLDEIQERVGQELGEVPPLDQLEAFVRQLDFNELLETSITPGMIDYWDPEAFVPRHRWVLFNPDPICVWLHARLAWWMFTKPFVVASLALMAFGFYLFCANASALIDDMEAVWSPSYFIVLIPVGILLVSVPHEFMHGVMSTHYGGHVTRAGFLIMYGFIPKFYLDRRQTRMIMTRERYAVCMVFLVGLYTQLVIASIAIVCTTLIVEHGGPAWVFWTALWSTAAWGAVHNCNIAHRRDAHRTMTTLLRIKNLRERCVITVMNWVARRPQPEPLSPREKRWFIAYGFLALAYYGAHGVFIAWNFGEQIMYYLQSAGIFAYILIAALLFHRPLWRLIGNPVRTLTASQAGAARRRLVRLAWVAFFVVILLIPYPYETGGPFQILSGNQTEIHCEIDGGRIEKVFVKEGASVNAGQPIAQIDQREYVKNVETTQAQLDSTRAQLSLLRKQFAMLSNPPNIEQIQALEAEARRLSALLADYKQQLELTTLRAPVTGRVTTPLVDQKVGQYLKKGDLFATVEQVQAVQVEIQVPEGDAPMVRTGARVKIVPWAYPNETFMGAIKDIAPVAAVPSASSPTATKVNSIRVLAELPNKDLRLKAQITGFAKIETKTMPLGIVLFRLMFRWFQVQFWYWLP
jgi:RND family efflux transporter MFP subunit